MAFYIQIISFFVIVLPLLELLLGKLSRPTIESQWDCHRVEVVLVAAQSRDLWCAAPSLTHNFPELEMSSVSEREWITFLSSDHADCRTIRRS